MNNHTTESNPVTLRYSSDETARHIARIVDHLMHSGYLADKTSDPDSLKSIIDTIMMTVEYDLDHLLHAFPVASEIVTRASVERIANWYHSGLLHDLHLDIDGDWVAVEHINRIYHLEDDKPPQLLCVDFHLEFDNVMKFEKFASHLIRTSQPIDDIPF